MMNQEAGRVPEAPGSHEPSPAVSALSGFDPSRSMVSYGPEHPDYPNAPNDWDDGPYLCRDGKLYHMRGYGWAHGLGSWNVTADWDRIAYRRRDSDGSSEAGETGTGSTVGDSAGPTDIAQPISGEHP